MMYEGTGRRLVLGLKHGDRLDIAPLAARWLLRAGRDMVERADVIAPVPLHWQRALRRKFNQSGELARELACIAEREEDLAFNLLRRVRWSGSQDGRSRADRIANVETAFKVPVASVDRMRGRSVLLIDDVLTTGATLSACTALCLQAGAKEVNILVLARVAQADRLT